MSSEVTPEPAADLDATESAAVPVAPPAEGNSADGTNAAEEVSRTEAAPRSDKRGGDRRELHTKIRIADFDGEKLPSGGDFYVVDARDISPSGLSFYLPEKPRTEMFIVLLGTTTNPILVKAKVMRTQEGYYLRKRQYLVGCMMLGKLN